VNPENPLKLNLRDLSRIIGAKHRILLETPLVLVFVYDGHEISLFEKGRMLIKNVHSEDEAQQIFGTVARMIGG
jgi:hypothetical protein